MYSNEIICKVLKYIDININTKLTIEDISKYVNYNRYYLMRLFKRELNISIFDYINILRIYNSTRELLNNKDKSLLRVAMNSGFYYEEYFSEIFKKILGITPSTYKKILNRNINITDKELSIYMNNYSNITSIIDKINKYKTNILPKAYPTRKLSIFK